MANWWVGLNVGSDQSTVFGTSSLFSPVGYESLPSGNAIDNAQFTAAALKNKGSSNPVTITVEGVKWFNIQGPYPSQAAANAAIPAIQSAHPAPGEASQLTDAATGQPQSSNSLGGLADIGDFFHRITEAATWERVGEVAAGLILLYIGIRAVTRDTAVGSAGAKSKSTAGKIFSAAKKVPK
jgi:hypothetical protein